MCRPNGTLMDVMMRGGNLRAGSQFQPCRQLRGSSVGHATPLYIANRASLRFPQDQGNLRTLCSSPSSNALWYHLSQGRLLLFPCGPSLHPKGVQVECNKRCPAAGIGRCPLETTQSNLRGSGRASVQPQHMLLSARIQTLQK